MNLVRRCTYTIEYHSKAFVEDAMYYARWILRLKGTDVDDRARMLEELGIGEGVSADRQAALLNGALGLEEMARRLRSGANEQKFLDQIALELESKAFEMRVLAEPVPRK